MPTVKVSRGTATTVLTTGLDSMANNANVLSSSVTLTSGEDGYRFCEIELVATFSVAPTANTAFNVWLLREVDGSNWEDGGTSVTPTRIPDAILTVRAVNTAQRLIAVADMPPGTFKVLIRNNATGQALASSGNTLKVRPATETF